MFSERIRLSAPPVPGRCWRALLAGAVLLLWAGLAAGHEIRPAIVDLALTEDGRYRLDIRLNLEAVVAGIGPEHADTDQSANAARYDQLRALPPAQLRQAFDRMSGAFIDGIALQVDGAPLRPVLAEVQIPEVGDTDLARTTVLTLGGELPAAGGRLVWRWQADYGANILRVAGPGRPDMLRAYLRPGEVSAPIPLDGAVVQSLGAVFADYLVVGFEHILPKGLDHILFVVGLFLFSLHLAPLLWQVTSFTLAHSVTLAMGMLGLVSVSPAIVEPLIALSIVYVCVENIFSDRLHAWRPLVIFSFGLLHGLGFAGVLEEVGLASGHFVTGLVAFNLGIELGQLAVLAGCFLLVGLWFRHKPWYRSRITVPASAVVAAIGSYWFVERVFL